jgi:hypothetical protein
MQAAGPHPQCQAPASQQPAAAAAAAACALAAASRPPTQARPRPAPLCLRLRVRVQPPLQQRLCCLALQSCWAGRLCCCEVQSPLLLLLLLLCLAGWCLMVHLQASGTIMGASQVDSSAMAFDNRLCCCACRPNKNIPVTPCGAQSWQSWLPCHVLSLGSWVKLLTEA